jgi:hypothetical protein
VKGMAIVCAEGRNYIVRQEVREWGGASLAPFIIIIIIVLLYWGAS